MAWNKMCRALSCGKVQDDTTDTSLHVRPKSEYVVTVTTCDDGEIAPEVLKSHHQKGNTMMDIHAALNSGPNTEHRRKVTMLDLRQALQHSAPEAPEVKLGR